MAAPLVGMLWAFPATLVVNFVLIQLLPLIGLGHLLGAFGFARSSFFLPLVGLLFGWPFVLLLSLLLTILLKWSGIRTLRTYLIFGTFIGYLFGTFLIYLMSMMLSSGGDVIALGPNLIGALDGAVFGVFIAWRVHKAQFKTE